MMNVAYIAGVKQGRGKDQVAKNVRNKEQHPIQIKKFVSNSDISRYVTYCH